MIIYGWGNYNRRDYSFVRTECPCCGHKGYHKSYTSSRFFTLYFIPVIPIGRQRILSECPNCEASAAAPYGTWRKLNKKEVPESVATYLSKPTDLHAAEQFMGAVFASQNRDALRGIGPKIEVEFARNTKLLARLADLYSYLCMDQMANALYLKLLNESKEAYIGEWADAHMRLRSRSKPEIPNRFLQSIPVLIFPAIVCFFILPAVLSFITKPLDYAYMANGLDHPYTATINGTELTLHPRANTITRHVTYGVNEIIYETPYGDSVSYTFSVENSRWDRAFGGPVIIINPDQAALILKEVTTYSSSPDPDDEYSYEIQVGEPWYVFKNIDFRFEEYPDEIDLPYSKDKVLKTRISQLMDDSHEETIDILAYNDLFPELKNYVANKLRGGDQSTGLIHAAAKLLAPETFNELAAPNLKKRPVEIEWHRAYQRVAGASVPLPELLQEYRAMVTREPGNSALTYLLARITEEPDESLELLLNSSTMGDSGGFAANALSYHYLLEGQFEKALSYSNQAVEYAPENTQFAWLKSLAMFGSQKYDRIKAELDVLMEENKAEYSDYWHYVFCMTKMGKPEAARDMIGTYIEIMRKEYTDEDGSVYITDEELEYYRTSLGAVIALAEEDKEDFLQSLGQMDFPDLNCKRFVLKGELTEATSIVSSEEFEPSIIDHLMMYVLYKRANSEELAAAHLDEVLIYLSDSSMEDIKWAQWLGGDTPPDCDMAAHTSSDIENHAIYMAALAARYPSLSHEYLQRAENIVPHATFYSLALGLGQKD
jgi:hypothetical protein